MSGPADVEDIRDAEARRKAIDVSKSFIVQAPAGSGKTGLLVQRFLALLARVEKPEAVLAITFTRKAAGEMRRRIVEALREASSGGEAPAEEFRRVTRELASAVLERDAAKGWELLHSPSRLQVFTIDGFCSRVVAGTPLLSRLGSTPSVVDDAEPLYREAVRRTLAPAGRELVAGELGVLLERYEMGLERLETQLTEMLRHRDQWSEAFFDSRHSEESWAVEVEKGFEAAMRAEAASLAADLEPGIVGRIHDLARLSRAAGGGADWPTLGEGDLLGPHPGSMSAWRQAACLLLKENKLRARGTTDRQIHAGDRALKALFAELWDEVTAAPPSAATRRLKALRSAAKLPLTPLFSPSGREAVASFMAVLRHAYLNLWQVFRERRQVDHVEVAMRAVEALAPGETLEKLDARIDHVLVDEFQDTNVLQCNLLRGLVKGWQPDDGRTVFLVGDPMQSIYRFRKAEVGLFLAARSNPKFLPDVAIEEVSLSVNFRSTRAVVGWVNDTFRVLLGARNDAMRSLVAFAPADPKPDAKAGEAVDLVLWEGPGPPASGVEADEVEAAGLAAWIAEQSRAERATREPGSATPIAVLVRARTHAVPLLRALERLAPDVRIRAPGLDRLSDRTVVIDLHALARAIVHPGDRLSWLAVLRSPWIGLTLGDLARLVETDVAAALAAKRRPTPLPMLLRDREAIARMSEDGRRRAARWLAIADAARIELAGRPLDVVVRAAWLRLGGLVQSGPAARLEALDADAFFDVLAARIDAGSVNLDDLSRALESTDAAVDTDSEADVEIMTMHKAKGLEFDTVVLPALGRGTGGSSLLPLAMETEPDSGLLTLVAPRGARGREDADLDKFHFLQYREKRRGEAECLRLLYVAATRARRRLLLSAASGRLRRSDGCATAGSLLASLADALDFGPANTRLVTAAAGAAAKLPLRFPESFEYAQAPASVADRSVAGERPSELELVPEHFSDDSTAACVGTVFHDLAERIAAEGIDAWPASRVESERPRIAHALRSAGVLDDARDEAVERVVRAVVAMLGDEKGRWILSAHEDARSEWGLTALRERRLVSAKLDRTFVAEGSRWIVDFKTGLWAGGEAGADVYVSERCEQYWRQLAGYRDLLREAAAGQDVRLALYFPEWPEGRRWQEITQLVVRLEAASTPEGM